MSTLFTVFSLDDDPVFNEILAAVLKKFGVSAQCFSKVATFRTRLRASLPNLILIDLNLEDGIQSYDLIQEIRKQYGTVTPILVVSGESEPKLIAHAIECGANDYILKPLNRELFASKLLTYIESVELLDVKMGFPAAAAGGMKATLSLGAQVLEVDELGIRLVSPHLLAKNSMVTLKSDLFFSWAGKPRTIFTLVTDTWIEGNDGFFGAYCEFDPTDEELGVQVRTWLSQKT